MNKCDVCGNTTFHQQPMEEVFHIEDHLVMVEGVPARVCDRCGDAAFDRQTTETIRRMVNDDYRAIGIPDGAGGWSRGRLDGDGGGQRG